MDPASGISDHSGLSFCGLLQWNVFLSQWKPEATSHRLQDRTKNIERYNMIIIIHYQMDENARSVNVGVLLKISSWNIGRIFKKKLKIKPNLWRRESQLHGTELSQTHVCNKHGIWRGRTRVNFTSRGFLLTRCLYRLTNKAMLPVSSTSPLHLLYISSTSRRRRKSPETTGFLRSSCCCVGQLKKTKHTNQKGRRKNWRVINHGPVVFLFTYMWRHLVA